MYADPLLSTFTEFCFSVTPPASSKAIFQKLVLKPPLCTCIFHKTVTHCLLPTLPAPCKKVILEFDTKKIMVSSAELARLYLSSNQMYITDHLFLFDMAARKLRVPSDSRSPILNHYINQFLTSWYFVGES